MKNIIVAMLMGLAVAFSVPMAASADVMSLRGHALDDSAKSVAKKKQMKVKGGIERSYKDQPPMIPHSVEKDRITLKTNTCMKCHSEKNYEKEKAPKVGDSHFIDRDGKKLNKLSSRRYFCSQCHAPQLDTAPLVDNHFAGAK
jgi:cytochrome c-type protein NapB